MLGLACGAPKATVPTHPPASFLPELAIRPTGVTLLSGASQPFQAVLNYPDGVRPLRQPIKWAVVEPGGGTITQAGVYTAPTHPGTYHVEARREDFPGMAVAVTVIVQ
jgi:hypothetical protein